MSKIEKEILTATGEKKCGRREDNDAYLERLVKAMHELGDDEWEELSEEAQEWFNDAAEALNDKKQLPAFTGSAKDESKISKRTSKKKSGKAEKKDKKSKKKKGKDDDDATSGLEEGLEVILYGKNDKVLAEGEVVEVGNKQITILTDDEEEVSVSIKRMVRFDIVDGGSEDADADGDADGEEIEVDDIEKGQSVRLVVDEEEVEGEVTKVNKKAVFIDGDKYAKDDIEEAYLAESDGDADGDAEELEAEDVKKGMTVSIEMKNGDIVDGEISRVAKKDGEVKTLFVDGTRCGVSKIVSITVVGDPGDAGDDPEDAEGDGDDETTDMIRDIICKFPKMKLEKIVTKVTKAKIEVEEDALENIYNDTHVVIGMLKEHGKLA